MKIDDKNLIMKLPNFLIDDKRWNLRLEEKRKNSFVVISISNVLIAQWRNGRQNRKENVL